MDLAARKTVEISTKLENLGNEFESWRNKTGPSSKFPQHNSQIREALRILECLRVKAQQKQTELGVQKTSMLVLATHRLWEFFRSKFSQRLVDEYKDYLAWADQLAWSCYKPARDFALKAPPLVYLNGGFSPFVTRRGSAYFAEIVANENFTDADVMAAQKKLPFPIIGVPYYQVMHHAEMASIGHEVGHVVEDDLELTEELNRTFEDTLKAGHPRLKYWMGWRRELFADVWGCLATGPAFASALADFKFGQEEESPIPIDGTKYPPPWLRIGFTKAVLESDALNFNVREILQPFQGEFRQSEGADGFLQDAKLLASAMLICKFQKFGTLPSLLTFTAGQQARAETAVTAVLKTPPQAISYEEVDIRVVTAAYRLAYDSNALRVCEADTKKRFATAFTRTLTWDARNDFGDVKGQTQARADALFDVLMEM
jgi:hypothetical protein